MNMADRIQNLRKAKIVFIIATCLNCIGFIIMLFDAFTTWYIRPFAMTDSMIISKIASVVFMIVGTTVFCFGLEKINYEEIRKFLMINIFAYAVIVSMIIYFLDLPYLWRTIAYIIVVFITEVILLKKKN